MDSMRMMQKTGLNRELRDVQIMARSRNGETLAAIAADYGISGEAVRRIIQRRGGPSTRDARKNNMRRTMEERAILSAAAKTWVMAHPGCTLQELADGLCEETGTVKRAAESSQYLVLDYQRGQEARAKQRPVWHQADACAAIAVAGEMTSPLSREMYDALRLEGRFTGPSGAWITTHFSSWSDACAQAGVQCGFMPRTEYGHKWTKADMLNWVARFMVETLGGTAAEYEAWAKQTDGAPSAARVRQECGTWIETRRTALELLRETWAF